jgi:hypothetical protein
VSRTAVAALALVAAACAPSLPASFACTSAGQCVFHGAQGTCEPNGACSFPDPACASGRRYGDFGPPGVADQCVGSSAPMPDGGGGAPPDLPAGTPQITRIGISTVPLAAHGTTLTLTTPGALMTGDFLLATIFSADAAGTVRAPSGWTVHAELMGNLTAPYHATWLYARVTAGGPSSFDFLLGANASSAGALVAYRGVAATTPVDTATNHTFEATNFIAPAITTNHANDMLVAAFVNAMSQGLSWTAPTGMQSAVTIPPIGIFDALQPTAGSSGDKQAGLGLPIPGVGAVDFLALVP